MWCKLPWSTTFTAFVQATGGFASRFHGTIEQAAETRGVFEAEYCANSLP
jgi:hypothetical protein